MNFVNIRGAVCGNEISIISDTLMNHFIEFTVRVVKDIDDNYFYNFSIDEASLIIDLDEFEKTLVSLCDECNARLMDSFVVVVTDWTEATERKRSFPVTGLTKDVIAELMKHLNVLGYTA